MQKPPLSLENFYVDLDIARSQTLPRMAFWDPQVLQWELETVFRKTWLCVPKQLFRVPEPHGQTQQHTLMNVLSLRGNAVKFSLLGEPVFLKRDFQPKGRPALHCFLNMCPHAWYPLMEDATDESNTPRIICQQHGLTAECDGTFERHPAFPDPDEQVRKRLSLTRYPLAEWADFFFICRGQPALPFEEVFKEVLESIAYMPFEKFEYTPTGPEHRTLDGNWKQHAWNYLDWLHIKYIHKAPYGLADSLDLSSAQTDLYKQSALMWAYAQNPEDGFDPKHLPPRFRDPTNPRKRVFALWWFVFPNLTLNFYPWGLSVNIYTPLHDDPEKIEFFWYHYLWDKEKYKAADTAWLNTLVDLEDIETMRFVRQNLQSRSGPKRRGLFGFSGPNKEISPHWFHRLVYEMMFETEASKEG